jgi:transposase InsO family protein
MQTFQNRLQFLRRRLEQLDCTMSPKLYLWVTINALKDSYPRKYEFLVRDMEKDSLTWEALMEELAKEDSKEKTTLLLSTQVNNSKKNRIHCTSCRYPHAADWPLCPGCNKHHPGGEDKCFVLHPELKEAHERKKKEAKEAKDGKSSTQQPSQRAAPTSIGFNSSLVSIKIETLLSSQSIEKALDEGVITKDSIVYDSGAAAYTFNDLKWFTSIELLDQPRLFAASNGGTSTIQYIGTARLIVERSNGSTCTMTLEKALYNPDSPCNLLSSGKLRKNGCIFHGLKDQLVRKEDGVELATVKWIAEVATLVAQEPNGINNDVTNYLLSNLDYKVLHRRFMHASKNVVIRACEQSGIKINKSQAKDHHCEGCSVNKSTEIVSREPPVQLTGPGQLIRMDLIEHDPGHVGYRYSCHQVDEWSGFHWITFLKTKDEAFPAFQRFVEKFKLQTRLDIQAIGIDGGTEFGQSSRLFTSSKLMEWAKEKGIIIKRTVPHTHYQNGLAERAGRTIMDKARTAMWQANIPSELWPFAMEASVMITNLLPTEANEGFKSPYQKMAEELKLHNSVTVPHLLHIKTYGCRAYVHEKKEKRRNRDKMGPRAQIGKLIGYDGRKIYWIWLPKTNKIVRASSVRFYEGEEDLIDQRDDRELEYEVEFDDPIAGQNDVVEGTCWSVGPIDNTLIEDNNFKPKAGPNTSQKDSTKPHSQLLTQPLSQLALTLRTQSK